MRNIKFLTAPSSAEERQIQLLEHALGVELSEELKEWFSANDGGWPSTENCYIDRSQLLTCPCSVYVEQFLSIEQIFSTLRDYRGRIPWGFLPIAHDGAGNLIGIALMGDVEGSVYFWDHENEPAAFELLERRKPDGHINLHLISRTMAEFLENLGSSNEQ